MALQKYSLQSGKFKGNPNPGEFAYIAIDNLLPPPWTRFETQTTEDLEESIRSVGIINPVIVCRDENGYRVLAGWRRVLAAKKLNLTHVPARIVNVRSEIEMIKTICHENTIRKSLSPKEILSIIKYVKERLGVDSVRKIAEIVGLSRTTVHRYLQLLQLPSEVRNIILEKGMGAKIVDLCRKAFELGASVDDVIRALQSERAFSRMERLVETLENEKKLEEFAKKVVEYIKDKDLEVAQYVSIKKYPAHARLEVKILDEDLTYWLHSDEKFFFEHLDIVIRKVKRKLMFMEREEKKKVKEIIREKIEEKIVERVVEEVLGREAIIQRVIALLEEAKKLIAKVNKKIADQLNKLIDTVKRALKQ